nr:hypothetical protein [Methanococcoides seepicolus]
MSDTLVVPYIRIIGVELKALFKTVDGFIINAKVAICNAGVGPD